jgi:hypothetical protein
MIDSGHVSPESFVRAPIVTPAKIAITKISAVRMST